MSEPLGRSQVLAYLTRLAHDHDITLISFEKPGAELATLDRELRAQGIRWLPQRYHRRPPVFSTLLDVAAGVRTLLGSVVRHGRPDLVHVRSDVPALIACLARRWTGGKLLFDIRGFWADERVEGGIWPQGPLYQLAKRCERWFYRSADAVVTLTEASVPQIERWIGARAKPVAVIPTCAEIAAFADTQPRADGPHAVWCGSIGTWYRFDVAVALAAELGLPFEVITRQQALAARALGAAPGLEAHARELPPAAVPAALHAGDIGICLCADASSKIASAPTRFAEHLAAGMPVIVSASTGDLAAIVGRYGVGVTLRGADAGALRAAAEAARSLAAEPGIAQRCRLAARELFDVDAGARSYHRLYEQLRQPA
jgi:glycosyltransferase involved in cell wall biosynthesis